MDKEIEVRVNEVKALRASAIEAGKATPNGANRARSMMFIDAVDRLIQELVIKAEMG